MAVITKFARPLVTLAAVIPVGLAFLLGSMVGWWAATPSTIVCPPATATDCLAMLQELPPAVALAAAAAPAPPYVPSPRLWCLLCDAFNSEAEARIRKPRHSRLAAPSADSIGSADGTAQRRPLPKRMIHNFLLKIEFDNMYKAAHHPSSSPARGSPRKHACAGARSCNRPITFLCRYTLLRGVPPAICIDVGGHTGRTAAKMLKAGHEVHVL